MNKFFLYAISLIVSFTFLAGCNDADKSKSAGDKESQPAFDLAAARKEIDSANRDFMNLVSKGDSVALANYYTMDAKMMQPNQPAVIGRKNIQTAIANLVNGGIKLDLTTLDVWGDESILAEEGTLIVATKDGKQLDKGKYIVLWKKEDGKWKLFRDFFNSDLPVPPAK
jgi:ketosteroid isomerase-like protein